MKALFLLVLTATFSPNAQASATDLVDFASCGAGAVGGLAISAKAMDAMKVKNNGVAFTGLMTGAMAGCAGLMYVAQPLAREMDGIPEDRELNEQQDDQ